MTVSPASSAHRQSSPTRAAWVDATKGVAILLVVFAHAQTELVAAGLSLPVWDAVNQALTTLRMPTFFLVSGLFARRSLTAPMTTFSREKLARFIYLYTLWSILYLPIFGIRAAVSGQPIGATMAGWLLAAATVDGPLWYLTALAAYFGVARLSRSVPVRLQIVVAGLAAAPFLSRVVATGSWGLDHMAMHLPFFLVGCYGSRRILEQVNRAKWWHSIVLGVVWVGAGVAAWRLGTVGTAVGGAVLPVVAVPFALTAVATVSRQKKILALTKLGLNTLPVYVLHPAMLALLAPLLPFIPRGGARLAYPVALTLVGLLAVTLVWLTTRRIPALFDLPRRLV